MSLLKALVRPRLWGLYGRIFYRKAELQLLCRAAHRRINEVEDFANFVGLVFKEATPFFSAVRMMTLKGMGYGTDEQGERVVPICWNAPIAITVYLGELPYLGLGVEFRSKALCIRQMQGVRGAMPLRNLKDWPELLVKTCMAWAEEKRFREVRVYKADQELGFEHPDGIELQEGQSRQDAIKAHQDRMRRRYDRTAQKLKFKKRKKYYVWKVPEAQPQ